MTDDRTVERRRHELREDRDTVLARRVAIELGDAAGFADGAREEIGIVASELSANVLNHADSGELIVKRLVAGDRDGVRIESRDVGPGIDDVEAAFADGESTGSGLGAGLGAVNRLSDRVTVAATGEPDFGTRVVADRWVRPEYERTTSCPLSFGAASRPESPGKPNGDTFVLKRWNDTALVGVIDGLGHGFGAHEASVAAKAYVEDHFDRPFRALFEGTDRACRGTRGVVMALARFDWAAGTVTLAGVGNVGFEIDGPGDVGYVMRRGVLGNNAPNPTVRTIDWDPSYHMAIYSDGLRTRSGWEEWPGTESATVQARRLLRRYGKDDDDATVLVVSDA